MNTWTPVWSKLPDSSVWAESKDVKILFITMLALKDRDHVVRYNAFELARKANLSEAEVLAAIEVLKSPDTRRLEPQDFEGRRIEKVEDGWLLLNGEKYRRKMQEIYRKEYKRVKQAEYRNESEPELLTAPTKVARPTLEEIKLVAARIGLPESEAEGFFNYYESNGWKVGKNQMKSYSHAMAGWKKRWTEEQSKPQFKSNYGQKPLATQADAINRQMREIEEAERRAMNIKT